MSYQKAEAVLPMELVELIQSYIDGECIYIPRKETNRRQWGESTNTRQEICKRNAAIYQEYQAGNRVDTLAQRYYLSTKSIQRIVLQEKRKCKNI